jgi:hypothetical protein
VELALRALNFGPLVEILAQESVFFYFYAHPCFIRLYKTYLYRWMNR